MRRFPDRRAAAPKLNVPAQLAEFISEIEAAGFEPGLIVLDICLPTFAGNEN
ncbi:MAG: hypothetical protein R2843_08590 [Thermomicrobiales bacterium]